MLTVIGMARPLASLNVEIDNAVRAVRVAQEELALAVNGLVPVLVGDKQLITPNLEVSFRKVRTAQDHVCDLQQRRARV